MNMCDIMWRWINTIKVDPRGKKVWVYGLDVSDINRFVGTFTMFQPPEEIIICGETDGYNYSDGAWHSNLNAFYYMSGGKKKKLKNSYMVFDSEEECREQYVRVAKNLIREMKEQKKKRVSILKGGIHEIEETL